MSLMPKFCYLCEEISPATHVVITLFLEYIVEAACAKHKKKLKNKYRKRNNFRFTSIADLLIKQAERKLEGPLRML